MKSIDTPDHDVVIVGAGCAGAATAMLLARLGYRVALLDRSDELGDTLSTHGLARGAVVQLSRWGLLDAVRDSGAPAATKVSFAVGDTMVSRPLRPSSGVDALYAPRRAVLDRIVLEAAIDAGATVLLGTDVSGVLRNDARQPGRVNGVQTREAGGETTSITAHLVIGADGVQGRTALHLGATVRQQWISPSATFYSYAPGLASDTFQFHVGERSLAGVFPTNNGESCVWLCIPLSRARPMLKAGTGRDRALEQHIQDYVPHLAEQLTAGFTAPVRGAIGMPVRIRDVAGPGWALVGDAAYHRDPVAGHGITDAFRDAELLAVAANRWLDAPNDRELETFAMKRYQRERDAAIAHVFSVTEALTRYPQSTEFVALQFELASAIDREAEWLASMPTPRRKVHGVPTVQPISA